MEFPLFYRQFISWPNMSMENYQIFERGKNCHLLRKSPKTFQNYKTFLSPPFLTSPAAQYSKPPSKASENPLHFPQGNIFNILSTTLCRILQLLLLLLLLPTKMENVQAKSVVSISRSVSWLSKSPPLTKRVLYPFIVYVCGIPVLGHTILCTRTIRESVDLCSCSELM